LTRMKGPMRPPCPRLRPVASRGLRFTISRGAPQTRRPRGTRPWRRATADCRQRLTLETGLDRERCGREALGNLPQERS
jgi:hypothetical protein